MDGPDRSSGHRWAESCIAPRPPLNCATAQTAGSASITDDEAARDPREVHQSTPAPAVVGAALNGMRSPGGEVGSMIGPVFRFADTDIGAGIDVTEDDIRRNKTEQGNFQGRYGMEGTHVV